MKTKSSTPTFGRRLQGLLRTAVAAACGFICLRVFLSAAGAQTAAGSALSFDGMNGYVDVANSPALNAFPLTVMGWFRDSDAGVDRGLVTKYNPTARNGYQVYLYQGTLYAWYFRDLNANVWDGARGLNGGFVLDNQWHHFAFTVDATGGKLYLDGALRDSRAWTGPAGASTATEDLQLGRSFSSFFNGQMDEISVWNVALSPSAIASAMNVPLATNRAGLLAYWKFDEGFGTSAADSVPSAAGNNTGKLFGGVTWVASGARIGPLVNTRGYASQTLTGVKVFGDVTPLGRPTTAWFEWGTNTSYGSLTSPINVGSSSNNLSTNTTISGLPQGFTYHYRIVATNLNGRANGNDQTFVQPTFPGPAGAPPLRSSRYDGSFLSSYSYEARPEWDRAVPMTVEAWVYRENANRFETILSHDSPGSYWLGFAPKLRFVRGTNFAEVPTPIPAFKWTHVAVSYDGAVARFYINGEYVGARPLSNNGAGKSRVLRLGHDGPSPGSFFPSDVFLGSLDEIRLWSVARSSDEIRDGLYREVRGEPGLAAAFPRGGRFEEVTGLVGTGFGVTEQIFGMVPRDLVVPRAAIQPIANGQVNLNAEYLGADQLVLRYPEDPDASDAVAYFVHTDNDLFVGVQGQRYNVGDWYYTNTWLGLFLDPTYSRPALAGLSQVQMQAFEYYDSSHVAWLNGDGGGGYFGCFTTNFFTGIRPCTPTSLWQIGETLCGDDVNPPPPCTEFRVAKTVLGSWDEFDGVALGHFNFSEFDDQTFVPENGFADSPATWLTMSYGEGSATLPRVHFDGHVYDGLTNTSAPLAGWRVTLFSGGAVFTNLTDTLGRFNFDVPMPTGQVVFVQVANIGFGRYRLPTISGSGIQPSVLATNEVRFPAIVPGTVGSLSLASVDFYVQRPLPPSGITRADPISPVAGNSVRVGEVGGAGDVVTIFGSNLHAEVEFYLSPATSFINPPQWTLLRAPVLETAPDRSWVKVRVPFVPERVPIFQGSFTIASFQSDWRWVSYDAWTRPNAISYTYFGNFGLQRPPYPLVNGFSFDNQGAAPSLEEFFASFGYNAYICVGAFGFCASHVPDPIYLGLWYPVYYEVVKNSGGSCVGMASTSLQLATGFLHPSDFDPLALAANGLNDPGFPGHWDTSNLGGKWTRPPIPQDVWARIRMNHGAQTSAEFIFDALAELDISVLNPSFGGNPVARLNGLRANPAGRTICMVPGIGDGHSVMPYRIEDNVGGDPNLSRIFVYDDNHPCPRGDPATSECVTNHFIDINHSANTYTFPDFNWSGSGLFTLPVGVFNDERHMPGITDIAEDIALLLLLVVGDADAHYTNSTGEWGWRADGSFVDKMPGLKALTPLGSPFNHTRSVPVFLPISNAIPVIEINVRDTNRFIFHAASKGTLLQLEIPQGRTGECHRVFLGATTNDPTNFLASFQFVPQSTISNFIPKIGLQFGDRASATFQWMGLTGEGGKVQEFRALKNRRAVEYCNRTGKPTRHYLHIEAVDGSSSNITCSMFGPFTVPAGAVHCVVLQDGPSATAGQIRSELDLNGDGIPDEVTMVTGTPLDSDGDGMPDAWELLHQLDPQSALCDDGPDFDSDHDGVSNYGEYLAGTDPHDPLSVLRLTAVRLPGNKVRLSWPAVPGRRYELRFANGLEYVFRPLANGVFPRVATGTEEHFDDTLPSSGSRFYSVRIVP